MNSSEFLRIPISTVRGRRLGLLAGSALALGGCSADVARFDFASAGRPDPSLEATGAIPAPTQPMRSRSNLIGGEDAAAVSPPASVAGNGAAGGVGYLPPQSAQPDPGSPGVGVAALPPTPAPTAPAAGAPVAPAQPAPVAEAARSTVQRGEQIEVQQGDTLYGLSRRHHVSVSELMAVNDLKGPNLKLGQRLYLPTGGSSEEPAPRRQTAAAPAVEAPADWTGSHTVQPGESLYNVARQYNVKVADLQRYNGISDVRKIMPGTVLKLPGGTGGSSVAVSPPPVEPSQPPVASAGPAQPASPPAQGIPVLPNIINAAPSEKPAPSAGEQVAVLTSPKVMNDASGGSANRLRWPVQGKIISGFGPRTDGTHNDGINLSVPLGTEVHAAETGTVAYAGNELKGYGNLILVRHDNGWVTAYAHNDELLVKRGDAVKRGQIIARAGRTGQVDQPQLHFEVRQGQKPVDPTPFMEKL